MAEAPGNIVLVSLDRGLFDELSGAAGARGLAVSCVPGLRETAARLAAGPCVALIVDFASVYPEEREQFLALHRHVPAIPMFLLETSKSLAPTLSAPMRRLSWPLPPWILDQIRATDRPVVLLTDQTLFATSAVQIALQQSGIQVVSLESTVGLVEFVNEQKAARLRQPEAKKSFWGLLGNGTETTNPGTPVLGRVVVAYFPSEVQFAESLDARLRQVVPESICYYVSGMDQVRACAAAIKSGQAFSVMRETAGRIPGFLVEGKNEEQHRPQEKERILLLDNFKPTLAALGQALIGAGYEVVTASNGEEVMSDFRQGAYNLAIIGTAIAYAQHSGAEFAQKLREHDPDLRIIFMVDRYPLQAALQGVSQVVELGLDDALLKPVESSRLIFSVQRALERRFLLLENARLLKEIQESNRQLAQINGFQKKFFAMVAHDVKNPLTAILGYSEVLGMRLKDMPNEIKCASHIHSAARTLNLLISDLVDLAAIESGKLRVEIGSLELATVVSEVRSRIEIVAQQRKINFAVEMNAAIPPLAGDPARIGQVIQNLCTNGIQYTKEGGKVTVRVQTLPDRVVVSVIDTGIGISKEDLPRIWERFFQTEEAKKMRKAGFGLGLKIAREIVQMHGGEMGIESQLGVGSRFFFHIPIKKA
ncbi:MAG: hybrid sensor histidine kinase/response regulator [Elusimicrobiota bacterium]|jgi:signal transduction histidine kinase